MLQAVEIETGAGEDVVVIDSHAIGSTAVINGLNIETGAQNDQILIDLSSPGVEQVIAISNFSLGDGHDILSIVQTDTQGGDGLTFASFFGNDVYLGDGDDQFLLDMNAQDAFWADIIADVYAGAGDDYLSLDNSDTTVTANTDPFPTVPISVRTGLNGDYDLGPGDDVFDLNVIAQEGEAAEADIFGGEGYDILNILPGSASDYTVEQVSADGYMITSLGQTLYVYGVEEINFSDDIPPGDAII